MSSGFGFFLTFVCAMLSYVLIPNGHPVFALVFAFLSGSCFMQASYDFGRGR